MKLISLKEHLELMKKNKSIALMDMDTFFEEETRIDDNQPRSIMTAHLKYRNPGDEEKLLIDQFHLSPSVKLNQDLLEEMEVYSNRLFRLYDNYAEPLENMVYWEVIKWIYINKSYSLHYRAYFSLRMELLSVEADTLTFDILNNIGCLNRLTERQISMNENTKQIFCDNAHGVILPYKPGDILYIDGNPFERPFYAVYCSEFVINEDGEPINSKVYVSLEDAVNKMSTDEYIECIVNIRIEYAIYDFININYILMFFYFPFRVFQIIIKILIFTASSIPLIVIQYRIDPSRFFVHFIEFFNRFFHFL